ncbi:MAG: hypothetical protein OSB65_18025 [Roseibacillus sp.]|nr:hypothetical protein [Roseibacillus sp.]
MKRLLHGVFILLPVLCAAQGAKGADGADGAGGGKETFSGKVVEIVIGERELSDTRKFLEWAKILKRAEEEMARAVVLRINTAGGNATETFEFMERIADLTIPTYAFVEGKALGAGALVAVSSTKIYLTPKSLIGGVGFVSSDEKELTEAQHRYMSLSLAKVRSVVGRQGRNVEVVQRMVFPAAEEKAYGRVVVPKGTLLTLNASEAVSEFNGAPLLGHGLVANVSELLEAEGHADAEVVAGEAKKEEPEVVDPGKRRGVSRPEGQEEGSFRRGKEESFEGQVVILRVGAHDLMNKQSFKYWRRMMRRAEDEQAAAVVFDLDTPGGLAFDTKELMTELTRLKVPSFAYVNPHAYSAGALVSVAADRIYMNPDGQIGAAGLVSSAGEIDEMMRKKLHSVFDAHLRTVAKKKGYDPELIRAMMIPDEKNDRVFGEVVVAKGTLLTLNAEEATSLRNGKPLLAKKIVNSIEEILAEEGLEGVPTIRLEPTGFELFAWWVARYSFLLILVGMGAGYAELKAPGFGVGGAISLAAFGIYFFGNHLAGNLAGYGMAALFVLGVLLILIEIFLIPGTGFTGIAGLLCVLFALLFGAVDFIDWGDWKVGEFSGNLLDILRGPVLTLAWGLFGGSILVLILMRVLPNAPLFSALVTKQELAGGASLPDDAAGHGDRVGWTGETITDLRPAGKARFSGDELDVIADGQFISKGAKVRIVEEDALRVVVSEFEAI